LNSLRIYYTKSFKVVNIPNVAYVALRIHYTISFKVVNIQNVGYVARSTGI
jgi:hypothetical protein